jgi:hypothetical protein
MEPRQTLVRVARHSREFATRVRQHHLCLMYEGANQQQSLTYEPWFVRRSESRAPQDGPKAGVSFRASTARPVPTCYTRSHG